jgi:hypothetical protein
VPKDGTRRTFTRRSRLERGRVWWLESRKPLSPADLDALFQQLTAPVLAAAELAR